MLVRMGCVGREDSSVGRSMGLEHVWRMMIAVHAAAEVEMTEPSEEVGTLEAEPSCLL